MENEKAIKILALVAATEESDMTIQAITTAIAALRAAQTPGNDHTTSASTPCSSCTTFKNLQEDFKYCPECGFQIRP